MKNNNYNIVIIDDEQACISNLCTSLQQFEKIDIIGTEQRPENGKKLIMDMRPDLLFIDVEMPSINGLELIREFKDSIDWNMQVIFYTAYEKYLLEALRESAFDYLLKPYEEQEFRNVMERFFNYMEKIDERNSFKANVTNLYVKKDIQFLLTTIKGYQMIKIDDIGYFEYEATKRIWNIILKNNKMSMKRGTSSNDILTLSDTFIQINQHQIINTTYLISIEGKNCTLLPPFDKKDELPISRKYADNVLNHFFMI